MGHHAAASGRSLGGNERLRQKELPRRLSHCPCRGILHRAEGSRHVSHRIGARLRKGANRIEVQLPEREVLQEGYWEEGGPG